MGVVNGTLRNDSLVGTTGIDSILGNAGNDTLTGNAGNDVLDGGTGSDILNGGVGNDTLFGGTDSDSLIGGAGSDLFVGRGSDLAGDRILDFATGDRIRLMGETLTSRNISVDRSATGVIGLSLDLDDDGSGETVIHLVSRGFSGNFVTQAGAGYTDILIGARRGGTGVDRFSGSADDEIFDGQAGNDILDGRAGNDSLAGGLGNDVVNGGVGNDTVDGGAGDDTLTSGPGLDTLTGGLGNDVFAGRSVDFDGDRITDFNHGTDRIRFLGESFSSRNVSLSVSLDPATGDILPRTMVQVDSNDDNTVDATFTLSGAFSGRNFVAVAGAGYTDLILAGQTGTSRPDTFTGSQGNDAFNGLAGNDTLAGHDGADTLTGDTGDDVLDGGLGSDILDGGAGNDILTGGSREGDTLTGGAGNDLFAGRGLDFNGDRITDFTASDRIRLRGESFTTADLILVRAVDQMTVSVDLDGDRGADTTLFLSGPRFDGNLVAQAGAGYTEIVVGGYAGTPRADLFNGSSGGESFDGLAGDDVLNGNLGNDTLGGGAGNDTLTGGYGTDILDGGAGNDLLAGGLEGDSLIGGAGSDIFAGRSADLNGDRITDFASGDRIRVYGEVFAASRVTLERAVDQTTVAIDVNNDRTADIVVYLSGAGFSSPRVQGGASVGYTDLLFSAPARRVAAMTAALDGQAAATPLAGTATALTAPTLTGGRLAGPADGTGVLAPSA